MKYVSGLLILGLLTGCDSSDTTQALDTSVSSSSDTSVSPQTTSPMPSVGSSDTDPSNSSSTTQEPSSTIPSMTQYLYVLIAGKVCAYPIDPNTKDLIQPDYGSWCVGAISGNLNYFTIDNSGKYLYAVSTAQAKVYMYSIDQTAVYQTYGSNIPLTALSPTTFSTNIAASYISAGSNGYIYIQNNNYSPYRLDKVNVGSTGLLTLSTTIGGSTAVTNEINTYGLNMSHQTSLSSGAETYSIDSQTNRIVHYTDGVIQSTFQSLISGTLTAISLH